MYLVDLSSRKLNHRDVNVLASQYEDAVVVDLANNHIRKIPKKCPKNLHGLNLSLNKIANLISFQSFQNLIEIRLRGNRINSLIDFIPPPHLKHLDISYNQITEIQNLESAVDLTTLLVESNLLHSIISIRPLSINKNLKTLNITGNPIGTISTNIVLNIIPTLVYLNNKLVKSNVPNHEYYKVTYNTMNIHVPRKVTGEECDEGSDSDGNSDIDNNQYRHDKNNRKKQQDKRMSRNMMIGRNKDDDDDEDNDSSGEDTCTETTTDSTTITTQLNLLDIDDILSTHSYPNTDMHIHPSHDHRHSLTIRTNMTHPYTYQDDMLHYTVHTLGSKHDTKHSPPPLTYSQMLNESLLKSPHSRPPSPMKSISCTMNFNETMKISPSDRRHSSPKHVTIPTKIKNLSPKKKAIKKNISDMVSRDGTHSTHTNSTNILWRKPPKIQPRSLKRTTTTSIATTYTAQNKAPTTRDSLSNKHVSDTDNTRNNNLEHVLTKSSNRSQQVVYDDKYKYNKINNDNNNQYDNNKTTDKTADKNNDTHDDGDDMILENYKMTHIVENDPTLNTLEGHINSHNAYEKNQSTLDIAESLNNNKSDIQISPRSHSTPHVTNSHTLTTKGDKKEIQKPIKSESRTKFNKISSKSTIISHISLLSTPWIDIDLNMITKKGDTILQDYDGNIQELKYMTYIQEQTELQERLRQQQEDLELQEYIEKKKKNELLKEQNKNRTTITPFKRSPNTSGPINNMNTFKMTNKPHTKEDHIHLDKQIYKQLIIHETPSKSISSENRSLFPTSISSSSASKSNDKLLSTPHTQSSFARVQERVIEYKKKKNYEVSNSKSSNITNKRNFVKENMIVVSKDMSPSHQQHTLQMNKPVASRHNNSHSRMKSNHHDRLIVSTQRSLNTISSSLKQRTPKRRIINPIATTAHLSTTTTTTTDTAVPSSSQYYSYPSNNTINFDSYDNDDNGHYSMNNMHSSNNRPSEYNPHDRNMYTQDDVDNNNDENDDNNNNNNNNMQGFIRPSMLLDHDSMRPQLSTSLSYLHPTSHSSSIHPMRPQFKRNTNIHAYPQFDGKSLQNEYIHELLRSESEDYENLDTIENNNDDINEESINSLDHEESNINTLLNLDRNNDNNLAKKIENDKKQSIILRYSQLFNDLLNNKDNEDEGFEHINDTDLLLHNSNLEYLHQLIHQKGRTRHPIETSSKASTSGQGTQNGMNKNNYTEYYSHPSHNVPNDNMSYHTNPTEDLNTQDLHDSNISPTNNTNRHNDMDGNHILMNHFKPTKKPLLSRSHNSNSSPSSTNSVAADATTTTDDDDNEYVKSDKYNDANTYNYQNHTRTEHVGRSDDRNNTSNQENYDIKRDNNDHNADKLYDDNEDDDDNEYVKSDTNDTNTYNYQNHTRTERVDRPDDRNNTSNQENYDIKRDNNDHDADELYDDDDDEDEDEDEDDDKQMKQYNENYEDDKIEKEEGEEEEEGDNGSLDTNFLVADLDHMITSNDDNEIHHHHRHYLMTQTAEANMKDIYVDTDTDIVPGENTYYDDEDYHMYNTGPSEQYYDGNINDNDDDNDDDDMYELTEDGISNNEDVMLDKEGERGGDGNDNIPVERNRLKSIRRKRPLHPRTSTHPYNTTTADVYDTATDVTVVPIDTNVSTNQYIPQDDNHLKQSTASYMYNNAGSQDSSPTYDEQNMRYHQNLVHIPLRQSLQLKTPITIPEPIYKEGDDGKGSLNISSPNNVIDVNTYDENEPYLQYSEYVQDEDNSTPLKPQSSESPPNSPNTHSTPSTPIVSSIPTATINTSGTRKSLLNRQERSSLIHSILNNSNNNNNSSYINGIIADNNTNDYHDDSNNHHNRDYNVNAQDMLPSARRAAFRGVPPSLSYARNSL